MNSDAAGRYQFMVRYWRAYQEQMALPDFGPVSQDIWAIQVIRECKALEDIRAGRLTLAIDKCKSCWASFPGSPYGQDTNTAMQRTYLAAGRKFGVACWICRNCRISGSASPQPSEANHLRLQVWVWLGLREGD
nr:glycoside hydrolase family protein [Pinirhizobacter soli]